MEPAQTGSMAFCCVIYFFAICSLIQFIREVYHIDNTLQLNYNYSQNWHILRKRA